MIPSFGSGDIEAFSLQDLLHHFPLPDGSRVHIAEIFWSVVHMRIRNQYDPFTNEFIGIVVGGPLGEVFEDGKFGTGFTDDISNVNVYPILCHEGLRELNIDVHEHDMRGTTFFTEQAGR